MQFIKAFLCLQYIPDLKGGKEPCVGFLRGPRDLFWDPSPNAQLPHDLNLLRGTQVGLDSKEN